MYHKCVPHFSFFGFACPAHFSLEIIPDHFYVHSLKVLGHYTPLDPNIIIIVITQHNPYTVFKQCGIVYHATPQVSININIQIQSL